MNWQDSAKQLPIGQRRKVPHCGPDATAYISNSLKGVSLHCFRCMGPGESEFEPHGTLSYKDILRAREATREVVTSGRVHKVSLTGSDVPAAARVWVLRSGLSPERASGEYGIGWSEKLNRVVVPVLHDGRDTGVWTARNVHGERPKYIMPKGSAGAVWYDTRLQLVREADHGTCVVTEDILSSIKVREAGYVSFSVLGTTIGQAVAHRMSAFGRVLGWFDGDEAGRKGYVKLRKALAPYGVEPVRINTPLDPKKYTRSQIQEFVREA